MGPAGVRTRRQVVINVSDLPAGVIPPASCAALWHLIVAPAQQQRRLAGHSDPPALAIAVDLLRAGALHHHLMSANGRGGRTSADLAAESRLLTTYEAAHQLGVSARHLRRLAAAVGITPAARNAWRAQDLNAIPRPRRR